MKVNERQLVKQLIEGEQAAFRWFYRLTQERLLQWFKARVKNDKDAEELVQDTYMSLVDSLPLYRGEAKVTTFLYSIAKHELYDYWRKKYAKRAITTIPFVDQVYTEKLYSAAQTGRVITRAYKQLTREQALLLQWKYEEGWSVERIARKLAISVKAAESRLYRARVAFQMVYEGHQHVRG